MTFLILVLTMKRNTTSLELSYN